MHSLKGKYIDSFYSYSFLLVVFIIFFVLTLIYSFFYSDYFYKDCLDFSSLEVYWTVLPGFILFLLSIPSLISLYYQDKIGQFGYLSSFQVLGSQWNWRIIDDIKDWYTGTGLVNNPDSGFIRNLSVEDSFYMCASSISHFIVSSKDVIHSFCLPELGVKVDCIAGRYNSVDILPVFAGVYYGQCSEVCGLNHAYMPMVATVLDSEDYESYLSTPSDSPINLDLSSVSVSSSSLLVSSDVSSEEVSLHSGSAELVDTNSEGSSSSVVVSESKVNTSEISSDSALVDSSNVKSDSVVSSASPSDGSEASIVGAGSSEVSVLRSGFRISLTQDDIDAEYGAWVKYCNSHDTDTHNVICSDFYSILDYVEFLFDYINYLKKVGGNS